MKEYNRWGSSTIATVFSLFLYIGAFVFLRFTLFIRSPLWAVIIIGIGRLQKTTILFGINQLEIIKRPVLLLCYPIKKAFPYKDIISWNLFNGDLITGEKSCSYFFRIETLQQKNIVCDLILTKEEKHVFYKQVSSYLPHKQMENTFDIKRTLSQKSKIGKLRVFAIVTLCVVFLVMAFSIIYIATRH